MAYALFFDSRSTDRDRDQVRADQVSIINIGSAEALPILCVRYIR